ncbi:MAG: FHA domain-containing protein [Planctomycetaceae bacterium]
MSHTNEANFRLALGIRRNARFLRTDGGQQDEIPLVRPCAVIGRSPEADLRFHSDTVSFRHAYLQLLGDRIFCVDLFSPNTLRWDDGGAHPWAGIRRGMKIGDGRLDLLEDGWPAVDPSIPSPLDFKPSASSLGEYGLLPDVELHGLNTALGGKSWPVTRVISLVGRDERCRITLPDPHVSQVHSSLVLLPSGLWAINLLGKGGTIVNGDRHTIAQLSEGSSLQIGPYRFRIQYRTPCAALPPPRADRASFLTKLHKIFTVSWDGDTLVVSPQGRSRDFRYQDIQVEANAIITILRTHGFRNVLVDFSGVKLSGSLVVDSITQFCRVASGSAAICGCSAEQLSALKDLNLLSLWPCHATLADGLLAMRRAGRGESAG